MKNSREALKFLILIFLVVSLGVLLLISFFVFEQLSPSWIKKLIQPPSPKITVELNATGLSFSQPTIVGNNLATSLILNPGIEKVVTADIVISFNPKALTFVDLEPGEVFKNPIVLKREINQERGRLRVALATQTPTQQQGSLVNLTFAIKDSNRDPIKIRVVKEKSQLGAIGKKGNILGEATELLYYPISK